MTRSPCLAAVLVATLAAPSTARSFSTQAAEAPKAAPFAPVVDGALGKQLDEHLSALVGYGFSGSVLVSKDEALVLCKGYGLSDRDRKLASEPDTLFDIGSLTKQFTAAAVLKLEEQGKLKLSDPLSKHLGEVPKDKAAITLHHLLTHTSGLPRAVPISAATVERDALVKAALATKLSSKPGAEFCYTNAGYDLLAVVVEVASGKRFEEYVKEELFRPAGLERTCFLEDPSVDAQRCAVGYEGEKRIGPAQEGWYSWGLRGAGGVLSSVVELDRWWRALDGGKVLSAASRKRLFEPKLLDYACGWWVSARPGFGQTIHHEGTTRGFESAFACYPERALCVIVLCNERETCKATAFKLAGIAAGTSPSELPPSAHVDPARLRALEGTYVSGKKAEVTVRVVGTLLALELSPEAVVLLETGREAKTLSADEGLTQRVAQILLHLRASDSNGLAALVSPDYPGWNKTLVTMWRDSCAQRGEFEKHEVLGFARVNDRMQAFVRVQHAEREVTLSLTFAHELLCGIGFDAQVPSGPCFAAHSENQFDWIDLQGFGGGHDCQLLFERDPKGRPTMLSVTIGKGEGAHALLAKRKR